MIRTEPRFYTDIADTLGRYNFETVARALGKLHSTQRLWQDARGRMCERGSEFAVRFPQ